MDVKTKGTDKKGERRRNLKQWQTWRSREGSSKRKKGKKRM